MPSSLNIIQVFSHIHPKMVRRRWSEDGGEWWWVESAENVFLIVFTWPSWDGSFAGVGLRKNVWVGIKARGMHDGAFPGSVNRRPLGAGGEWNWTLTQSGSHPTIEDHGALLPDERSQGREPRRARHGTQHLDGHPAFGSP